MAGIYIHIPFCKKICYYCDFYKSANYHFVHPFVESLIKEIYLKKTFTKEKVNTIYFGGGTPSSIPIKYIDLILNQLQRTFDISHKPEITFELNPDDADIAYLETLKDIGVNRLSIGIQSFNDSTLKFLNRRHNAKQSFQSINDAKKAGFSNISIDLIYGIQNQEIQEFLSDLQSFFSLGLSHLSAYHLMIEEKTHFGRMLKKGIISEVEEAKSMVFYNELINSMKENNYGHYEISNFALHDNYSKHNISYWKNIPYIGLGPSAHSYDGNLRYWNISSVKEYIYKMERGLEYFEKETLNTIDKYNEYLLTGLRTKWGCDLNFIKTKFGEKFYKHCLTILDNCKEFNILRYNKNMFFLSEQSLLQSDYFIEKFIIEK